MCEYIQLNCLGENTFVIISPAASIHTYSQLYQLTYLDIQNKPQIILCPLPPPPLFAPQKEKSFYLQSFLRNDTYIHI